MLFGLFLGYFVFSAMSWLMLQGFGIAAGFALSKGWLVTNLLGVVVLLCMFVLMHITLALVAFRLISVVPHQVVKLIGFQPANRVDIERFSQDAGMVGMGATMRAIEGGGRTMLSSAGERGTAGRRLADGTGSGSRAVCGSVWTQTALASWISEQFDALIRVETPMASRPWRKLLQCRFRQWNVNGGDDGRA